MTVWREPIIFQWDDGNRDKNWVKHRVTNAECEEVFFDPHKRLLQVELQTGGEARYILIGKTKVQRLLFVVFTLRGHFVRIISARSLNKNERELYEKAA